MFYLQNTSIYSTLFQYCFRKESALILYAGFIKAIALALMIVFVNIVMFISFTIYVANGGELTSKKVFTTISLLINLRLTSIHFFVQNVLGVVEAQVAAVRLQVSLYFNVHRSHLYIYNL